MAGYFALIYSLKDSKCKVVPAGELFHLQADMKAVPFNPKNEKSFVKTTEYGRLEVVDGVKKIVRCFIFLLSQDVQALTSVYTKDKARFVPPKRLSITSDTVEDVMMYKFPSVRKDCLKERQNVKQVKSNAQSSGSAKILKEFEKKGNTQSSNFPLKLAKPILKGSASVSSSSSSSLPSASKASFEYSACGNIQHLQLQMELDTTLSKYERALLEIKRLKDLEENRKGFDEVVKEMRQLHDSHETSIAAVQNDLKIMKEILKRLERVEVANSAVFQSQLCQLPADLVSSDEEDEVTVDETKFRVDRQLYVSRELVLKLEMEDNKFICHRIERLCDMMCNNNVAGYSLSGFSASGNGILKITSRMVKSILKLLRAMQWPNNQTIKEDKVRNRISKYCSAARSEDTVKALAMENKLSTGAKRKSAHKGLLVKKVKTDGKNDVNDDKEDLNDDRSDLNDDEEELNDDDKEELKNDMEELKDDKEDFDADSVVHNESVDMFEGLSMNTSIELQ